MQTTTTFNARSRRIYAMHVIHVYLFVGIFVNGIVLVSDTISSVHTDHSRSAWDSAAERYAFSFKISFHSVRRNAIDVIHAAQYRELPLRYFGIFHSFAGWITNVLLAQKLPAEITVDFVGWQILWAAAAVAEHISI